MDLNKWAFPKAECVQSYKGSWHVLGEGHRTMNSVGLLEKTSSSGYLDLNNKAKSWVWVQGETGVLSEKFNVRRAAMIKVSKWCSLEGKVQYKALVIYYLFISNNNVIKEVPLFLVFYIWDSNAWKELAAFSLWNHLRDGAINLESRGMDRNKKVKCLDTTVKSLLATIPRLLFIWQLKPPICSRHFSEGLGYLQLKLLID